MKAPTFFLSSTIYDFKDLRSALRYYLEEQGCRVLASEYNDFPKPLNTHSYEACLQALKKADYFILLIGERVGGWYDESNRISITQREYREAYNLHLQGKLKLINLIRADIWRLREDRKDLVKHIKKLRLDPAIKKQVVNYQSKAATDAEFIAGFIDEVCKHRETKEALSSGKPLPTGNWIHVFDSFKDVIDVVNTQAFAGLPIEHATLRRLLMRELLEYLRVCLVKLKPGMVCTPRMFIEKFHSGHTLTAEFQEDRTTVVDIEDWDTLSTLSIQLIGARFTPLILPRALESSTFLKFDIDKSAYVEEPVYEALYQLQEEIRIFTMANVSDTMRVVFENSPPSRGGRKKGKIAIPTMKLWPFLHLLDRWVNIIELARAVIVHLRGAPFSMPKLRPSSPIAGFDARLAAERATKEEIENFISQTLR